MATKKLESEYEAEMVVKILEKYANGNTLDNFRKLARYIKKHTSVSAKAKLSTERLASIAGELASVFADEKHGAFNTRNMYIGYLYLLFRVDGKQLPEKLDHLRLKMKQQRTKNDRQLNKQKVAKVDVGEILSQLQAYRKSHPRSLSNWQKEFIFTILSTVPVRLNELVGMRWVDNEEDNYIDLEEGKMVIRKHKAAKQIGAKEFPLSEEQLDFLKLYKSKWSFDFVLIRNQKPYQSISATQSSLRTLFSRQMAKYKKKHNLKGEVGIHAIRQNYVTSRLNNMNIGSGMMDRLREIQDQLGHTTFLHTLSTYFRTMEDA